VTYGVPEDFYDSYAAVVTTATPEAAFVRDHTP